MKEVRLPIRGTIQPTPGKPVNLGEAMNNHEVASTNGKKIIYSSLHIERLLEEILAIFFFKENMALMKFFERSVLKTGFFTFENKKRVVREILNELKQKGLMTEEQRSGLLTSIGKIITYRNAFTHGDITEKSDGTYIVYFNDGLVEKKLDDVYWDTLMTTYKETNTVLTELANVMAKGNTTA